MNKVYIAGDMLKQGNQMLRKLEKEKLESAGLKVHNPMDDEEINDKKKDPKAEDIFRKDTQAIIESETIIFDADDNNVGTTTEVGQVWGINFMLGEINKAIDESDGSYEDIGKKIMKILGRIPLKDVYWHNSDIRNVEGIKEEGLRRSYSLNQYLHGCLLDMSGEHKFFDEIVDILSEKAKKE